MPTFRRAPVVDLPPARTNALIAAATLVKRSQISSALKTRSATQGQDWQADAWEHYERCGELRYGCTWLGNSLGRARLYAARKTSADADPEPVEDGDPAAEAMTGLCGGSEGQSAMLQRLGPHLTIPGESFIVGWETAAVPATDTAPAAPSRQQWATLCNDEIREDANGSIIVTILGTDIELPEESLVIRLWRPHPRRHWEADSPTRGLDIVLTELDKLTSTVAAQADSRLAGAGLLLLPLETSFPSRPPTSDSTGPSPATPDPAPGSLDSFLQILTEAMVTPITDRDDASAVVPIVVQAPGEHIKEARHITFATPLSAEAIGLRQEAIRRIALGLDMPPEVLTGMGDTNHWGAWQIDESAVKGSIEPALQLICAALTEGYLRPVLGEGDDSDLVVWFDTTELVQRPDRSSNAKDLYDRGELSGDALRREGGFGDADKPSEAERKQRAIERMIDNAGVNAELAQQLLEVLGWVEPGDLPAIPAAGEALPPAETSPNPGGKDDGGGQRALPSRPEGAPAGDTPPAEQQSAHRAYLRATVATLIARHVMDYAGKRLLRSDRSLRGQGYADLPPWELHTAVTVDPDTLDRLLDGAYKPYRAAQWDAYDNAAAGGTAGYDTGGTRLLQLVDDHVREALTGGAPLDYGSLRSAARDLDDPARP